MNELKGEIASNEGPVDLRSVHNHNPKVTSGRAMLAATANKGRDDPRGERMGRILADLSRIPFVEIVAMKEKRRPSLFIDRLFFEPFILSNDDDRVTLLLAAIQPENIGLAALCSVLF